MAVEKSMEEILAEAKRRALERLGRSPEAADATQPDGEPTRPEWSAAARLPLGEPAAEGAEPDFFAGAFSETYRVCSEAIRGGMGEIRRVRHMGWNTDLAMKRPQAKCFDSEKSKSGFIRECESWIGLGTHPNIVTCYYVREIDGVPTIFSEWMNNGSLGSHIRGGTLYTGSLLEQQRRLLDIAIQFARGLHYAHERDLIHQDVKPDNLLLTEAWDAKVADFGLAKARLNLTKLEGDDTELELADPETTTITPSGGYSLAYASPEQLNRQLLTRRTDIFSWAVSVLEMYLGERCWVSGNAAGEGCRGYFASCRVPVPTALQTLLVRCMARRPEERPHDFSVILRELTAIYEAELGTPYPRPEPRAAADTADSLNNRALSLLDLGMEKEARSLWELANRVDCGHIDAAFNYLRLRWRRGEINDLIIRDFLERISRDGITPGWLAELRADYYAERGSDRFEIEYGPEIRASLPTTYRPLRFFLEHNELVVVAAETVDTDANGSRILLQCFDADTGTPRRRFPAEGEPELRAVIPPDSEGEIMLSRDLRRLYLPDHTLWDPETQRKLCDVEKERFLSRDLRHILRRLRADGAAILYGLYDAERLQCLQRFEVYRGHDYIVFLDSGVLYRRDADTYVCRHFDGTEQIMSNRTYLDSFRDSEEGQLHREMAQPQHDSWRSIATVQAGGVKFKLYESGRNNDCEELWTERGNRRICTCKGGNRRRAALAQEEKGRFISLSRAEGPALCWRMVPIPGMPCLTETYRISRPENAESSAGHAAEENRLLREFSAVAAVRDWPAAIEVYERTLYAAAVENALILAEMDKHLRENCVRTDILMVQAVRTAEPVPVKKSPIPPMELTEINDEGRISTGYRLTADGTLRVSNLRCADGSYGLIAERIMGPESRETARLGLETRYPSYEHICGLSPDLRMLVLWRKDAENGCYRKILLDLETLREVELPFTTYHPDGFYSTESESSLTGKFRHTERGWVYLEGHCAFELRSGELHTAESRGELTPFYAERSGGKIIDERLGLYLTMEETRSGEHLLRIFHLPELAERCEVMMPRGLYRQDDYRLMTYFARRTNRLVCYYQCSSLFHTGEIWIVDLEEKSFRCLPLTKPDGSRYRADVGCFTEDEERFILVCQESEYALEIDVRSGQICRELTRSNSYSVLTEQKATLIDRDRFLFVGDSTRGEKAEILRMSDGIVLWSGAAADISDDGCYLVTGDRIDHRIYWKYTEAPAHT